jgi:hypothetical protein
MSPGTDFSMYQKVANSTISNVSIDHSRANHKTLARTSIELFLPGQADEQSKMNAAKKTPTNSSVETWNPLEQCPDLDNECKTETNFTRAFEGNEEGKQ